MSKTNKKTETKFVEKYSGIPISLEEVALLASTECIVGDRLQQLGAELIEAQEEFESYLESIDFEMG